MQNSTYHLLCGGVYSDLSTVQYSWTHTLYNTNVVCAVQAHTSNFIYVRT